MQAENEICKCLLISKLIFVCKFNDRYENQLFCCAWEKIQATFACFICHGTMYRINID